MTAAAASSGRVHHVEPVMGTIVSFDIRSVADHEAAQAALVQAVAWFHYADTVFSTFLPHSDLSRLQRGETTVGDCPPEMTEVLALAAACEERTGGAYTTRWCPDRVPDPTGIVKGWAAKRASAMLAADGCPDHTVNAAGDVRLSGHPAPGRPWATGIAHPLRPGNLVAVVEATECGVATSGVAERGLHILDPRTGRPARGVASATVICPDLGQADGYATAAVSRGHEAVALLGQLEEEGCEWLLVAEDGAVRASAGFPGPVLPAGIRPQLP